MTEKRFNYIAFDGFEDDGEYITPYQVVKLLNELHEENMMLKGVVAHYKLILLSLKKEGERISRIHCLGDNE